MSNIPTIFVSSTCYDLRQIREDLHNFIKKDLGYRPLLSDQSTFPVDPDLGTVDNCRKKVDEDADVFLLIIGGRYGSVDSRSSKSITNLEYLSALTKGIPIYAFVEKRVLAMLPIWESNPTADFSSCIDDVRLFEFISRIRNQDSIWMYEFDNAQNIIDSLRIQLAYRMSDGLKLISKLRNNSDNNILQNLRGESFRIALEKPPVWEHRLFAQVLIDELREYSTLRFQHKQGIVFGRREHVPIENTHIWMQTRMSEATKVVEALDTLVNDTLNKAVGAPGEPGNVADVVITAQNVAQAYAQAIEWAQRIKCVEVDEIWEGPISIAATFNDDMIEEIEAAGPRFLSQIEQALQEPSNGKQKELKLNFCIKLKNQEAFHKALAESMKMLNTQLDSIDKVL